MKIIGKNSLSQYISYLLFVLFIIIAFHLVYEIIGHTILLYKYKTGSTILSDTFALANDVGWSKNKWTIPMENQLKFRINYPFSNIQMVTGIYGSSQIIHNIIGMFFLSFFFYFSYQCFKEMSVDQIFNQNAIKWLKRFCFLNLTIAVVGVFEFFYFKMDSVYTLLTFFFFAFFGMIILFVVEFFKKGLALQTENDLTI
ncbi:DUF2975 domain-containing protein [Chryseobacterium taiwanense]|uniref:DUF2975 domain-containing protein n=1 Tax=Chryseobacterium taiwanense TaxID=363331 RepID=A0A0B4ED70_9FLAO|nr:DUF2975 domain-containing protein [Chryseobacterium taiwanense]KIC64588.1 hypothetical protein RM51_03360 [Chryseobacterium taiwanense]